MDVAQTRAGSERSTQVLVIGQKSLLGDLRPVLRALAIGIAFGLAGMTLVTMFTR
jgi:hypothetical protein